MTKEYRITTENAMPSDPNDCYLAPEDPIHQLKAASIMGGLGSKYRLAEYNTLTSNQHRSKILDQRAQAIAQGIKPGTPAWFALFPK